MKNIAKMVIKGNYFEQETILDIYGESRRNNPNFNDYRAIAIYGKNGSGKSSICDLLSKLSKGTLTEQESVKIFDNDEHEILLSENELENICVYDENFINDNINFKQDGLNTIVMFGQQKDLDEEITVLKEEEKANDEKLNDKVKQLEKTNEKNGLNNPMTFFENIKRILTRDGGWAEREGKQIGKGSRKASVNDDYIKQLISKTKSNDILEQKNVIVEYDKKISIYEKIDEKTEFINLERIKIINVLNEDFENLKMALEVEFKQDGYSEREQKILELIKKYNKREFYSDVKETFLDKTVNECPYCFQKVTDDHKSDIVKNIENVLNEEIKYFTDSLVMQKEVIENYNRKLLETKTSLLENSEILNNLYLEYNKLYDEYEVLHLQVINEISKKIENPYIKRVINVENIINKIIKINENIAEIILEFKIYNENIKNVKSMKNELSELNEKRALIEIESDVTNYKTAIENLKKINAEKNDIETKISILKDKIEKLSMQKKNVGIALSEIQKWLKYIYLDSNKISLEYNDLLSQYVIKSNGKNVKLNKLSTGEKNIISLCYFFSKLMANKNVNDAFNNPLLIILDDPISSFDYENKVGVYSFLRMMFSKILLSNEQSKIFTFTHSIEVDYFLTKTFCDFLDDKFIIQKTLQNKSLINYKIEKKNQYSELLNDIYNFASNNSIDVENNIGNSIRKVLEAYGTFNYKLGIEKLSTDTTILEKIPKDKRYYFENLMYRLILHGDSHLEQETRGYVEQDLFYNISLDEKQKVAKSILVFLYFLDRTHLEKHYKNDCIINNIKSWSEELKDV